MSYLDFYLLGYDTMLVVERCEHLGGTCCLVLNFATPKMQVAGSSKTLALV